MTGTASSSGPACGRRSGTRRLSLATNLAVADALLAAGTGLFRVMAGARRAGDPPAAPHRARRSAWSGRPPSAWPTWSERSTPRDPKHAAFMLAIRRAGGGATYVALRARGRSVALGDGCHVRARDRAAAPSGRPLRDRRSARRRARPSGARPRRRRRSPTLPAVMEKAETHAAEIERTVIDLVEAVVLAGPRRLDLARGRHRRGRARRTHPAV